MRKCEFILAFENDRSFPPIVGRVQFNHGVSVRRSQEFVGQTENAGGLADARRSL